MKNDSFAWQYTTLFPPRGRLAYSPIAAGIHTVEQNNSELIGGVAMNKGWAHSHFLDEIRKVPAHPVWGG